ncbi:hypothetical protein AB0D60_15625 [Streptomyces sp. NPDC048306]|uniref:DUF6907 domain-containing protein n=1 Tax=Streptomyces sp. NPDC048306 TaxID=3154502 RepID=UPI0033DA9EF6
MSTITAGRDRSTPLPFVCPPWCVVDHYEYDVERVPGDRDVIHRSAFAYLRPDASLSGVEEGFEVAAQLASPELGYAQALLVVDLGESIGSYAELDVERADQFIRDLKTFTARVQQLRDQLAKQNGVQS